MIPGRLRAAIALSAVLHTGLFLVPVDWWEATPGGDPFRGGRAFIVSLFPSAPEEDSAAPELVPEEEPEAEPEIEPGLPEPVPPEPAPVETPVPAGTPAPGGAGSPVPSTGATAGIGTREGSEVETGKASFRAPRPLSVALPIDPENPGDLEVPPEIPVRLWIGTDGSVLRVVSQVEDLPPPVQAALEESARSMRFIPASRGGTPVEAWFSMTFVFRD